MAGLITHDWVSKTGGAEIVLQELVKCFPDADLRVLWSDREQINSTVTYESWISKTPLRNNKALALPFMPVTWRIFNPKTKYEWIFASTHLFAHHAAVNRQRTIPKFLYVHTPARYIWEPELDQRGNGALPRLFSTILKPIDRHRAEEATALISNSRFTSQRIEKVWGRVSDVIYPPVDVDEIQRIIKENKQLSQSDREAVNQINKEFILGASRLVSYKRLDRVIALGQILKIHVVIAGTGPELPRLKALAKESPYGVTFITTPTREQLIWLFRNAKCYVFPAIEDFGIMPVEAIAAGCPVIVSNIGGAKESIELTGGGIVARSDDISDWKKAYERLSSLDCLASQQASNIFSSIRFRSEIKYWLQAQLEKTNII